MSFVAPILRQDGSVSTVQFASRRCFNHLGCQYMYEAPPTVNLIQCKEQCGATFCSETCRDMHNAYGHHIACANIKAAKKKKMKAQERARSCCNTSDEDCNDDHHDYDETVNRTRTLEEEKEEKFIAELTETRTIDLDFAKLELMVCHDYDLDEVDEMHHGDIPTILANARVKDWFEEEQRKRMSQVSQLEMQMSNIEADDQIRCNMSLPAVFHKGIAMYRRYRPGQRVVLGKGWQGDSNMEMEAETIGTVIRMLVHDGHTENNSPYEIETDEGVYLCVPDDTDPHIQHEEGSYILSDEIIEDEDLLRQVQREIEMGYPSCNALRALPFGIDADDNNNMQYRYTSKLNRRNCHCCGKTAKSKFSPCPEAENKKKKKKTSMPVCTGCQSVAYCSRECQVRHWPEHKHACRAVQDARQDFLLRHPDAEQTKEGRRYIRTQSLVTHRYHILGAFFEQKCGNVAGNGTTRLLQGFVMRAVESTLMAEISADGDGDDDGLFSTTSANNYGREEALHNLAREVMDEDSLFSMGASLAGSRSMSLLTTQNLCRLVAGVVHFGETDRDLAVWCLAALDAFLYASFYRPIVPE